MKAIIKNSDFGSIFTLIIIFIITGLFIIYAFDNSKSKYEGKTGFTWYDIDGDGIKENLTLKDNP